MSHKPTHEQMLKLLAVVETETEAIDLPCEPMIDHPLMPPLDTTEQAWVEHGYTLGYRSAIDRLKALSGVNLEDVGAVPTDPEIELAIVHSLLQRVTLQKVVQWLEREGQRLKSYELRDAAIGLRQQGLKVLEVEKGG